MLALIASVLLSSAPSVVAPAREGAEPILDPRTYRSPNGKYALFVDPTARDGSGSAKYKLSLDGKELWSRDEPITLYRAALGDDGVIAGYAYTHGYRDARCEGKFCVAISAAGGTDLRVVASDARVRLGPEGQSWPYASDVIVDGDSDRVIVRSREKTNARPPIGDEEWRVFKLAAREFAGTVKPLVRDWTGRNVIHDVKHVRGTPLQIVVWPESGSRLRFALMDCSGRVVAPIDPEFDAAITRGSDELWNWTLAERAIVETSALRQCELVSLSADARVTFEAVPPNSADGTWSVREVARVPAGLAHVPELAPLETVTIEPRGEYVLASDSLREARDVCVGPTGRIFVAANTHHGFVHVFDANGKLLHVINWPEDTNKRTRRVMAALDGAVWIESGPAGNWAIYDALGARAGSAELSTRAVYGNSLFLADGRVWTKPGHRGDVVLREVSGVLGRRIERRPDGRWLRDNSNVCVAPTGELCVSDWGDDVLRVSFYSREGEPLAMYETHPDVDVDAFTGKWVLGVTRDGWLTLLDPLTGKARRADLHLPAEEREGASSRVFSSPDGREAWVFDLKRLKLRKYALPES